MFYFRLYYIISSIVITERCYYVFSGFFQTGAGVLVFSMVFTGSTIYVLICSDLKAKQKLSYEQIVAVPVSFFLRGIKTF